MSSLEDISEDLFRNNSSLARVRFVDLDFSSWKFENSLIKSSKFVQCHFIGCIFDGVDLQRVEFEDCIFENTLFNRNFRFITGRITNSELRECDFSDAFIQNTQWVNNTLRNVDFRNLKAKTIDFSGSSFDEVNFDGAKISRGRFKSIPGLTRRQFYNVDLEDCEFDWNEAFVIMEFGDPRFDELYAFGIEPVLRKRGVDARRVDQYEFHGRITDEILQNIVTCEFVIAECSAPNKNVYFEVGYALGNHKQVILCVDKEENIPFDLKDYRFIIHDNSIRELRSQLEKRIDFLLEGS